MELVTVISSLACVDEEEAGWSEGICEEGCFGAVQNGRHGPAATKPSLENIDFLVMALMVL